MRTWFETNFSQRLVNPVVIKELRSRMRGGRAFATLTAVLFSLGAFSYAIYRMAAVTARYSSTPMSPLIGQLVFGCLAFLELMIICIITPAITAGAISGEKEKLTYEMLLATPLHPASILWGKLLSALSYVFLLIFAAIPLASLVFIFGGVALRDMFKALVILVSTAVMLGVIGLFMSTLLGRSGRATAVTYAIVLLMLLGPLFTGVLIGTLRQTEPPRWALIPSPISALGSALSPSVNPANLSGVFWVFGSLYNWVVGAPPISYDSIPRPIYHYSLVLFGTITLLLYLVSTRLTLPARRWRIQWTELVLALIIMLGFLGMVAIAYLGTANRYENILIQTPPPPSAPAFAEPTVVPPFVEPALINPPLSITPELPPTQLHDEKRPPEQTPTP